MEAFFSAIKDTPVPTILIVGGLLFLLLAISNQLVGKVSISPGRQKWAAAIGGVLVLLGIALHLAPSEQERIAREQKARERAAQQQAAQQKAAQEQAAREQAAREQEARERAAQQQATQQKAAQEQAAREQAAREQKARKRPPPLPDPYDAFMSAAISADRRLSDRRVAEALRLGLHGQDSERARRLLAEAGYPDGLSLEFPLSRFREAGGHELDAETFIGRLRQIKVRVNTIP